MNDEDKLRRLTKEAIRAGKVPAEQPTGTWGGNGSGAPCNICGLPISNHDIGFELEFSQEGARARSCHLHSRCFAAWEFERHIVQTGQARKGSNGRPSRSPRAPPATTDPEPATHSQRLSAEDKGCSMPDHERNPKGRAESA